MMSNGTSSALNSEQDLASIPMAGGGLSRLAIARLKSARRAGGAASQACGTDAGDDRRPGRATECPKPNRALLDEAASALKDDCLGFTLARHFDPRELGLHALKRVAQQDYQRAVVSPPER